MLKKTPFKHAPCPTCLGKVEGRRDKRFCSLTCKNEHHRMARYLLKTRYGELQKRLNRNLIILEGTLGTEHNAMIVHKNALFKHGFDLFGHTSSSISENKIYYELENYRYCIEEDGKVHVWRLGELSEYMPVFFRRWQIDFPDDLVVDKDWMPKRTLNMHDMFSKWNE